MPNDSCCQHGEPAREGEAWSKRCLFPNLDVFRSFCSTISWASENRGVLPRLSTFVKKQHTNSLPIIRLSKFRCSCPWSVLYNENKWRCTFAIVVIHVIMMTDTPSAPGGELLLQTLNWQSQHSTACIWHPKLNSMHTHSPTIPLKNTLFSHCAIFCSPGPVSEGNVVVPYWADLPHFLLRGPFCPLAVFLHWSGAPCYRYTNLRGLSSFCGEWPYK